MSQTNSHMTKPITICPRPIPSCPIHIPIYPNQFLCLIQTPICLKPTPVCFRQIHLYPWHIFIFSRVSFSVFSTYNFCWNIAFCTFGDEFLLMADRPQPITLSTQIITEICTNMFVAAQNKYCHTVHTNNYWDLHNYVCGSTKQILSYSPHK